VTREPTQNPQESSELDDLTYEQLVEQLDGVVRQLEAGELSLEESLGAFERGVRLARAAERRLDQAEHRVEVLLQGDRVRPLDSAESRSPAAGPTDDDIPF
jgi:exodeoxyribonuclease VII small subunit